jgi:hypothetical protein
LLICAPRVEVEVSADHGHQALGIGGVVDRERRGDTETLALASQDPHAGGVEGADPHRLGPRTDQGGHALLHLAGRLVGEGDGQDLPWLRAPGSQQVRDPVREDAGLAGAGAGHDQERTALVPDRLALRVVEPFEQGAGVSHPWARDLDGLWRGEAREIVEERGH